MFQNNAKRYGISLVMLAVSGLLFLSPATDKIRFSDGWKFYKGDATNAQAATFSDAAWIAVSLPHSVQIELNYRSSTYYLGVCWYRKTFTPDASLQGKKLFLEFGAAMQSAQVWVNGTSKITHVGGYTPFVIDMTNNIQFGTTNVIAIRMDNTANTSIPPGNTDPDFLYFGGLYRDVHIIPMDSLHITNALYAKVAGGGGVFVTYPSVGTSSATVQVVTQVINEYASSKSAVLATSILTAAGTQVATTSTTQTIAAGASASITQTLTVTNPQLWHPDHPNLYVLRSAVSSGTTLVDTLRTTIGIRTIAFSKANGFQINGSRYIFRGANRHQAYPYIGNAVPASGQLRDAQRMKDYGFNFVRMCHYTQSEVFVESCDRLGILGMACLPGWQYFSSATAFTDNSIAAEREMIRYYRNHPSVIMYESMHNESTPTTAFLTSINTAAHAEYPGNQMFTCGEEGNGILDVYIASSQHSVRSYTGTRACEISEYGDWDIGPCVWADPITGCADRIERKDGEASMLTQAYNHYTSLSQNRALSWLTGDALWTVLDYQTWSHGPLTSSGCIDIFRLPKFGAYFFKSQRSPGDTTIAGSKAGPMVFIANYWTASSTRPVTVFSNCDSVALYLNNTLVAKHGPITGTNLEQPPFSFAMASFTSGTLRADGLIGGVVRATHSVSTPGTAAKVVITMDTARIPFLADGADVAIVYASIQDANGTVVPTATNSVTFSITGGSGTLIGNNPVAAEAGIASILLKSSTTAGTITMSGAASGLTSGTETVASVLQTTPTAINYQLPHATTSLPEISPIRQNGTSITISLASAQGKTTGQLFLYNCMGKKIKTWDVSKNNTMISLEKFPQGVYMVKLDNGMATYTKKVAR
jgi:beta-galactosidase